MLVRCTKRRLLWHGRRLAILVVRVLRCWDAVVREVWRLRKGRVSGKASTTVHVAQLKPLYE